jgi:hypothetical protein
LTYLASYTICNLYDIPSLLRGAFYDGHNTVGNDGGGYVPFFSAGTTCIHLSFNLQAVGRFPTGGFVLDVEDISVPTYTKSYWYAYSPPNPPWYMGGSFVDIVMARSTTPTYYPNALTWRDDTGGISYTPWPDDAYADNALMQPGGGIYTRRKIRMPKFATPGYFDQLYIRFFNQSLYINGGLAQFYIHGLYWRDASDSSDHLIWSPPPP